VNLLPHTALFQAGIARSGAYNHSLTPFGFQSEQRTYWEALDTYIEMSPFTDAKRINEPILAIHGADDPNPGTYPVQSERLFEAIKGNGGTVRWVVLLLEEHGYRVR
jgi:dipeptidyl aminopeptidase/acylaminoacyl peptidase